jgi:hypothetical protein
LVEIDELAVQAATLVEVAAGNLEASGIGEAARLQRVKAGGTDQPFDRRRGQVVVGGVEENGPLRLAICRAREGVAGKADWGSFGLPLEGTKGLRAGEFVRADVPTCGLEARLQDVQRQVSAVGWDTRIVVNSAGVVLGRLGRKALATGGTSRPKP